MLTFKPCLLQQCFYYVNENTQWQVSGSCSFNFLSPNEVPLFLISLPTGGVDITYALGLLDQ